MHWIATNLPIELRGARADGLMVELSLPGEHWEIEFMLSGHIEVERFRSDGAIQEIPAVGQLVELLDAWG